MKTQLVAVGTVILIIGLAVLFYGLSTPIAQTNTTAATTTQVLVRDTSRVVSPDGFWAMGVANLVKGETVTGSVSVSNYSSSDGPLFFYVLDEPTFIKWGGCAPCGVSYAVNASLSSSGTYSIDWTVPAAGSYYFVLDASYYSAASPATFSATGMVTMSTQSTQLVPNTSYNYAGFAVAVLGAIVLAAGLILGPTTKKGTGP